MSEAVRSMFSDIAPRYDAANDVLSLGIHRLWRAEAVRRAQVKPGDRVLDCATGTGDLALAFARAVGPTGRVVATDFCAAMLERAPAKAARAGLSITFEEADALALPYPADAFDVASMAFGIRNVDDPRRCLRELARVVRPGGRVAVLEFGQPEGVFGAAYRQYARSVLPAIGHLVTGRRKAYEYLPRTAQAFPSGDRFLALMDDSGAYSDRRAHPLLFGLAWVYVGTAR